MKIFDEDGKVAQSAMWIATLLLMLSNALIWWAYAEFGYMEQGMFAAVANAVLGIYTLQFPRYFRRIWFYITIFFLFLFYLSSAFVMPAGLPKNVPTSLFLWPFALATIGMDMLVVKLSARVFDR